MKHFWQPTSLPEKGKNFLVGWHFGLSTKLHLQTILVNTRIHCSFQGHFLFTKQNEIPLTHYKPKKNTRFSTKSNDRIRPKRLVSEQELHYWYILSGDVSPPHVERIRSLTTMKREKSSTTCSAVSPTPAQLGHAKVSEIPNLSRCCP